MYGQHVGAKDEGITREPKEGTQVSTSTYLYRYWGGSVVMCVVQVNNLNFLLWLLAFEKCQ